MSNNKPRIGLFIGDVTGIGPEITAKVVAQRKALSNCFIIGVGDHRVFQLGQRIAQLALEYPVYDDVDDVDFSKGNFAFLDLKNLDPNKITLGQISPASGKVVGDSLKLMVQLALSKKIDAVVYAPINKEALYRGGYQFKGEIGFFAYLLGVKDGFGEMNVLDDL